MSLSQHEHPEQSSESPKERALSALLGKAPDAPPSMKVAALAMWESAIDAYEEELQRETPMSLSPRSEVAAE